MHIQLKKETFITVCVKGVLHILQKFGMFSALSQNNQHLLEKNMYASYKKIFKKLKNGIEILVGQAVF